MTKVQLTLTTEEASILSAKADRLGYGLTRFIKFLISREATNTLEENIPTIKMSKKAEKIAKQAYLDYKQGKTTEITSFSDFEKTL